jgi:Tfp pilus assembly protein PilX
MRDRINQLFDVLELLIIRMALLALLGLGAYNLFTAHQRITVLQNKIEGQQSATLKR